MGDFRFIKQVKIFRIVEPYYSETEIEVNNFCASIAKKTGNRPEIIPFHNCISVVYEEYLDLEKYK
jgi:hypothetical protein